MKPALRKYNAMYLRCVADLIEAGDYNMEGIGGAFPGAGDVITIKLDLVATPSPEGKTLEEPVTVAGVGKVLLMCMAGLENWMEIADKEDQRLTDFIAVEKAKEMLAKIGLTDREVDPSSVAVIEQLLEALHECADFMENYNDDNPDKTAKFFVCRTAWRNAFQSAGKWLRDCHGVQVEEG